MQIFLELGSEIFNPITKEVFNKTPWVRGNSLVRQFIQLLQAQMQSATISILDTSNISRNQPGDANIFRLNASDGDKTYGIVIGQDNTPVTINDYALKSQLITGVSYGVVDQVIENPSSNLWRLVLTRSFTNNTFSTLTVKEVALYAKTTSFIFCLDRALYDISIPNSLSLMFTYRINIQL